MVITNPSYPFGGLLKWWYPTTMGFPTKNDHFGVFWGYHHLRKHPFIFGHFLRGPVSNLEFITIGSGLTLVAVDGSRNAENSPVDMIKYPVIWEYFKTSRVVNQISEPSKKYASGMCFFWIFPGATPHLRWNGTSGFGRCLQGNPLDPFLVGGFSPTQLKNMLVKMSENLPQVSGWT